MINDLESLIAVFEIGLGCGIFSKNEVIVLCDSIIEKLENVPYEIIEASLMKDAKTVDIESKLSEFHKRGYNKNLINIILSIIGHKFFNGSIDIAKAVQCSTRLLVHSNLYIEQEYYNLYSLEDAYDLAEGQIYGDIKDVVLNFTSEISNYNDYFVIFNEGYFRLLNTSLNI